MKSENKKFKLICCGMKKIQDFDASIYEGEKSVIHFPTFAGTRVQELNARCLKKAKKNSKKVRAFQNYFNKQIALWEASGVYDIAANMTCAFSPYTKHFFAEDLEQLVIHTMQYVKFDENGEEPHFCKGHCGVHDPAEFDSM